MRVVITAAAQADLLVIRRCVHGDYLLFYRLHQEVVEVIHILQGARDIEALLFQSP